MTVTDDRILDLRPVSGRIGVEVVAPDLDRLVDDEVARAELHRALLDHHVVVLPGLHPTPEQHIAMASAFGDPVAPEDHLPKHPDHPLVCRFDSAVGYKADKWHTDGTFRDVVPSVAVLTMRTSPATGGDTVWANCCAAYDDLSNGMKRLIDGRKALHDQGPDAKAAHPVVVVHPDTGLPILFVNDIFTRGIMNLPPEESNAILPFLIRHVSRPEFTYRHSWAEGDVVIWDNRSTQHYALFDFDGQRVVERVHVAGGPMEAYRIESEVSGGNSATEGPW
jgi:taurine dioxygenase